MGQGGLSRNKQPQDWSTSAANFCIRWGEWRALCTSGGIGRNSCEHCRSSALSWTKFGQAHSVEKHAGTNWAQTKKRSCDEWVRTNEDPYMVHTGDNHKATIGLIKTLWQKFNAVLQVVIKKCFPACVLNATDLVPIRAITGGIRGLAVPENPVAKPRTGIRVV